MKHLNNIGSADLKLLKEIYKDNFSYAEEKLNQNYPIQYLIGYVDFYDCKINVDERVLIPRFETELLVHETLKVIKNKNYQNGIDICTGSGAIAIAMAKTLKIKMTACDISDDALNLAKINAKNNNTPIDFFKIDILHEEVQGKYDFIISNPPYVKPNEYTSKETKWEPKIALYANHFGLEFYEAILKFAPNILNKGGTIAFEIGATEAEDIKKIALTYFPNAKITVKKDFNNFDRFLFIEN